MQGLGTQAHAGFTPEQNAALAAEVDRAESQAVLSAAQTPHTRDYRTAGTEIRETCRYQ